MKKTVSLFLTVFLIITSVFLFNANALEQDDLFANYKVNDMLVMEGQTFYIYNYDNLAMVYKESDSSILQNEGNGKFVALKKGVTNITLSLGKASKTFAVTVCSAENEVPPIQTEYKLGYFGSSAVFGEDKATLLNDKNELYLVGKTGKDFISSDVASYITSNNKSNWNELLIITNDSTLKKWTYDTKTKKGTLTTLFDFIPIQSTANYVLSEKGNVYDIKTGLRICINAVKISQCGFVLLNDGSVIDLKNQNLTVCRDAKDIDTKNPLVLKNDGALFLYTYIEESNSFKGILTDSEVVEFINYTSFYKKTDCIKYYNTDRTVIIFDFSPLSFSEYDGIVLAVNEKNDVYINKELLYGTWEKLGSDFKSFYNLNNNFGYTNSEGIVTLTDKSQKKDYSLLENSNHSIDSNNVLYAQFGTSDKIKVMESVIQTVQNPIDGNSTFILRADGSVFHCDQWTWYPRKAEEKEKFYPTLCMAEYKSGDVNQDGAINTKDAKLILRYTAKLESLTPTQIRAGDVDLNGKTNTNDARRILRYVAGLAILDYLD